MLRALLLLALLGTLLLVVPLFVMDKVQQPSAASREQTVVDGSWYICGTTHAMLAPQVTRETLPLVQFQQGTMQWTDGCNTQSRPYRTTDSLVHMEENVRSTERLCILESPEHLKQHAQFVAEFVHGMFHIRTHATTTCATDETSQEGPRTLHLQSTDTTYEPLVLVQPVYGVRVVSQDIEGFWAFRDGDVWYHLQPDHRYKDLRDGAQCVLLGLRRGTDPNRNIGGVYLWTTEVIVR
jgi:hypothetical protein